MEPKLAKRRLNRHSTIKSGRTIGERSREHIETSSERLEAKKKIKKRQNLRIIVTVIGFLVVAGLAVFFIVQMLWQKQTNEAETAPTVVTKTYTPSIEVVDENATGGITTRMSEYIGQLEADLREAGYIPTRAVIPAGAIREVDIYLDGYKGRIKTIVDRGTGVTVEDIGRMLRYLASQGVAEFEYIDVRIDGKAYWK